MNVSKSSGVKRFIYMSSAAAAITKSDCVHRINPFIERNDSSLTSNPLIDDLNDEYVPSKVSPILIRLLQWISPSSVFSDHIAMPSYGLSKTQAEQAMLQGPIATLLIHLNQLSCLLILFIVNVLNM